MQNQVFHENTAFLNLILKKYFACKLLQMHETTHALFVQWIGQRIPNPQKQVRILYRALWICSKTVMQRAFNP